MIYDGTGLPLLALEVYPATDDLPAIRAASSTENSDSALSSSGQLSSFGGGFGQSNLNVVNSAAFGSINNSLATGGFGTTPSALNAAGFGTTPSALTGGGFGGGQTALNIGGFGQSNTNSGTFNSGGFGAFGQSSVASPPSSFGQADANSGTFSGGGTAFGSFGSFGTSNAAAFAAGASGQTFSSEGFSTNNALITPGFGQSATANVGSGGLSGSFGSFGGFGQTVSPPAPGPVAAAPKPFNLSTFGSFGGASISRTPASNASSPVAASPVAIPEPYKEPEQPTLVLISGSTQSSFLARVRNSFYQHAVQLFLANCSIAHGYSSKPVVLDASSSSTDSITDADHNSDHSSTSPTLSSVQQLLLLQQQYQLDIHAAISSVAAYCLAHCNYLAFLSITMQSIVLPSVLPCSPSSATSRAVSTPEIHTHPYTAVDVFLRRELYALAHLIRSKDLSTLSCHEWGQLKETYREIHLWRQALALSDIAQTRNRKGSVRSEYNLLTATIHSCLLLWALLLKDYPTVLTMLESRFANFPSNEPAPPVLIDEAVEDNNNSTTVPAATTAKIDPLQPLKQRLINVTDMLLVHAVFRSYTQNFLQTFYDTFGGESSSSDALNDLANAFHLGMEYLQGQIMMSFQSAMKRLSYMKAEYEKPEIDEYGVTNTSTFPLQDALKPLSDPSPYFLLGTNLLTFLNLVIGTKALAAEIIRSYEVETAPPAATGSAPCNTAHFHTPIDIFKYQEKGDLPQAVAVNSVDNRFIAVATTHGIREIHVPNTIKYRKRNVNLQLEEDEAGDWNTALHRYDNKEKTSDTLQQLQLNQTNPILYPNAKHVLAAVLQTKISRGSLVPSSLHDSRVYQEFTGP